MVQTAIGSDRQVWAANIGRIIVSLNEIDWLIGCIYTRVFREELSPNWLKKTFSERIDLTLKMVEKTPKSSAMSELKKLIECTLPLNETRNHVAHGTLALVGTSDGAPRGASFEMLRYYKKSDEMRAITFAGLEEQKSRSKQLSDDYSLFLAKCEMFPEFVAPYI